jgi:hypothetical protein
MLPYLLAVAGGYLIGDSMNETSQFTDADGGMMAKGGGINRFEIRKGKVIYTSATNFDEFKKEQRQNYSSIRMANARNSAMMSDWKIIEEQLKKMADGGMMAKGGIAKKYNNLSKEEREELMREHIGVGRTPSSEYEKYEQLSPYHKELVDKHLAMARK